MITKKFVYPDHIKLLKFAANSISILLLMVIILSVVKWSFHLDTFFPALMCKADGKNCLEILFVSMISIFICQLAAHQFQEIILQEKGLILKNTIGGTFIRWDQIGEIQTQQLLNGKIWIIVTNKFNLFHWIYGIFRFKFRPVFSISSQMINHTELLSEISKRKCYIPGRKIKRKN